MYDAYRRYLFLQNIKTNKYQCCLLISLSHISMCLMCAPSRKSFVSLSGPKTIARLFMMRRNSSKSILFVPDQNLTMKLENFGCPGRRSWSVCLIFGGKHSGSVKWRKIFQTLLGETLTCGLSTPVYDFCAIIQHLSSISL